MQQANANTIKAAAVQRGMTPTRWRQKDLAGAHHAGRSVTRNAESD
jgi:hypothetical protein